MYKKVELKDGFAGMENKVAEMWKQKNIIKKNFEMNKGQRYFTFYDGPPTANGKPHMNICEYTFFTFLYEFFYSIFFYLFFS